MAVNYYDPGINKRTVSTSLFEKIKMVSVTAALVHIRSWSIYVTESLSQFSYWKTSLFFWLPGFQRKNFALALFFLARSVSFVQCFLITSVFIGLLQPNLATLAELRSHRCEVPMVFMKIASLVCALICLLPFAEDANITHSAWQQFAGPWVPTRLWASHSMCHLLSDRPNKCTQRKLRTL